MYLKEEEKHFFNYLKVHDPKFSCGQLVAEDCDMATQLTGHKV